MPPQQEDIIPVKLASAPGVKRDGTLFEGSNYVDGQWCRYQRGLPRSMPGYRRLTNLLSGVPRGMNVFDQNNETYTHIGNADFLQSLKVDPNGTVSAITDRTPGGFAADSNNLWQFDQIYDSGGTQMAILAHAAPNAMDISSDAAGLLYYGDITAAAALGDSGATAVSGGVVVLHPYTFTFGSDGIVAWSVPNDPTDWSGTGAGIARIASSKVVAGKALRAGAGNAPSGLFWTLNNLVRATFVGSTQAFQFDTISPESSILSAASVIEYNGVYFWVGVDSFLIYNGVVRELPNNMNINYFFDNLNYAARQKVFAYKVPRFGEIWWCYPRGSATECTHAVIYNVREDTWYDTELPNSGRSCAQYAQVFRTPLMCGVDIDASTLGYKLWQHEFGTDAIDGPEVLAIYKAFETGEFYLPAFAPPDENRASMTNIVCNRVEPDFVQTGDMQMIVKGRPNARASQQPSSPYTFVANPTTAAEQLITIRGTNRYLSFRFESNVAGGSFEMGHLWAQIQTGDGRVTS